MRNESSEKWMTYLRSHATQEMLIICWMTHSWQTVAGTSSPNVLTRAWPLLYHPSRIFQIKQISKNELVLSQSPLATTLLLSPGRSLTRFCRWGVLMTLTACTERQREGYTKGGSVTSVKTRVISISKLASFMLVFSDFQRPVHDSQLRFESMTIRPIERFHLSTKRAIIITKLGPWHDAPLWYPHQVDGWLQLDCF